MPFLATSLTGCSGGFFGDDEVVSIESIETSLDEDGNTVVTIIYNNLDYEPVTFTIPKGNDGKAGYGISGITQVPDAFGNVVVTISFEDPTKEDVVFSLKPGTSITRYETVHDAELGKTTITFYDSEGHALDPIEILDGDTGEQGIGIKEITSVLNDDHTTTVTFVMTNDTDEDPHRFDYIVPGVSSVDAELINGQYVLTLNYTDGSSYVVSMDAPINWYSGGYTPTNSFGMDGDYFFDTAHGIIYHKEGGIWNVAVRFSTDGTPYTITFNLNDEGDASMPEGYYSNYTLARGEYFAATGKPLPTPSRYSEATHSYYKFVGWCTAPNPGPTNGYFTDLTPVFGDLTLYAIWE